MKQLLSILLALTMLFCFAGCQFVEDPDDTDDEVVGGGLVQARDGEEIDDVENDPVEYEPTEEPDVEDEVVEEEDIEPVVDYQELSEIAPEEGVSFYALIIGVGISSDEEGSGYLNVCELNTTVNDVNHDDLFSVGISADTEILDYSSDLTIDKLSDGDVVVITYNGEVMESYPAQIANATRVYVVDHIDHLSAIAYYLPEGYEDFGEYFPDWDNFEY